MEFGVYFCNNRFKWGSNILYPRCRETKQKEYYYVEVTEIRLGSALIDIPGKRTVGYQIPVWDTSYNFYERYENERTATVYKCHVYLNAINGKYIEPRATREELGLT